MVEISEAAKAKACELAGAAGDDALRPLANETWRVHEVDDWAVLRAFSAHIQQVSDAAKGTIDRVPIIARPFVVEGLAPFLLSDPVDTLAEAMSAAMCGVDGEDYARPASDLRAELAKRGLEIREVGS